MTSQLDKTTQAALKLFDLKPSEELVYLTCLTHGALTAQSIAEISDLKRTTVYGLCEYLRQKGLLSFYQQRSHRLFFAEHPSNLLKKAKEYANEAAQRAADLERTLPVLTSLYQQGEHQPYVQLYTGPAQIKQAVEALLEQRPKEVLFVANPSIVLSVLGRSALDDFITRRQRLKISSRGIYTADTLPDGDFAPTSKNLRSVRTAKPDFVAPMYTGIYNNNVLLISDHVEVTAIRITSRAYAETMRSWFEAIWKSLD